MSCSSVRHFPLFLDGKSSALFQACQFFHKLVGFLAVVLLQVFFDTLPLFFNPCPLCFPHAFFKLAGWLLYKVLHLQSYSSFVSVLSVCRTALSVTQGFFASKCLPRMLLAVSGHGSVKAVDQGVYFSVLIFKGEEWSKLSSYHFCDFGVLEFLKTEPDPYVALVFHPLEAESEGYHYELMLTSNISSWKTPGLCNVHT